ncbi:MAG: pentapeptide repeat-containing protein [Nostocaceae cyanobacterium]|nr:pentapeptide repeat-containing protein [Nostocaceae cyanobacterium]
MVLLIPILILFPLPAQAQSERPTLTVELLQQRLRTPIIREGIPTVDLSELVIDLRPENPGFSDAFYHNLRKELQRAGSNPLGLDLSYSLIQGDFNGSELGLRTPLIGQALAPIFTTNEQEQLERDRHRLVILKQFSRFPLLPPSTAPSEITVFRGPLTMVQTRFAGNVQFTGTFFLQTVTAKGAIFTQEITCNDNRFSRGINFTGTTFRREAHFQGNIFFGKADFNQTQFQERAYFQNSTFGDAANFNQAVFKLLANFSSVQWQGNSYFSQVRFLDQTKFTKSSFHESLFLTEATFEQAVTFREAEFNQPVNLRGASILNQADFSDTEFAREAYLNVPGIGFNSDKAKILGNTGQIGKLLVVPSLQGNENLLRNLVRNFRMLQQIADANQVQYTIQRLRLRELSSRLFGVNINTASVKRLQKLGFSVDQATAIAQRTAINPLRNINELLTIEGIDLGIFLEIRDRAVVGLPLSVGGFLLSVWHFLGLSLLLLLSRYGSSFWLVLGVGMIAIVHFGLIFWLVDRFRRLRPTPIIPTLYETTWMLVSYSVLGLFGFLAIFRTAEYPWLTMGCLAIILLPIPALLLFQLYEQGRYHDLMDVSYFTEDASMRQLRLLIGRLPVIPRYQMFRERYMPLLWNRNWNWLNYYDFSLNNLLKIGFNDIRLRDEHLPGIITALAWYQWSLGIVYIITLLWTLSRTIPGVNLLIYLK